MTRMIRLYALAAILLGQILMTAQTFAMSGCDTAAGNPSDAETVVLPHHADDAAADHDACAKLAPPGTPTTCQCAEGAHCGQLTLVLPASAILPGRTSPEALHPRTPGESLTLAYSRNPDRPPA